MKNNTNKTIYLFFALIAVIFIVAGLVLLYSPRERPVLHDSMPATYEDVIIGYIGDQTGDSARFGLSGFYALQRAADSINAKGGLLGRKFRIINRDDQADPELSRKQAEDLIFNEKALAIIAHSNSANVLNYTDIAQENEVPVIVSMATATAITAKYADSPRNYIFRTSLSDLEQARLGVAWALYKTKNGDMAIIHDSTSYGRSGLKDVSEILGRWGKTPHIIKEFDRDASNEELAAMMMAVKESGADSVYLFALADSNIRILKAIEQTGYNPLILISDADIFYDFSSELGRFPANIFFPGYPDTTGLMTDIGKQIEQRYEFLPVLPLASQAYDALLLLEAAIKRIGNFDSIAIRDTLEEISNIQCSYKLHKKPFSKDDHEALDAGDVYVAHWVDGALIKTEDDFELSDIR